MFFRCRDDLPVFFGFLPAFLKPSIREHEVRAHHFTAADEDE